MATENSNTATPFSEQVRGIYDRAMCSDLHESLICLNGIADAIHPFFSELEDKQRDALVVGLSPLTNLVKKELNEIFAAIESLTLRMEAEGVSHG